MAKVTVEAAIFRRQFEQILENEKHVVLSFVQKGFEISNKLKFDEQREDQELFITKKNLVEWENAERRNEHAIGKSYYVYITRTFY
jgi:hypothetical protein